MKSGSSESNPFRTIKIFGMICFVYAIFIPLVGFIIPISDVPQTTAPTAFSLVMMALMPFELFLVYVFYRVLGKQTKSENITGIAVLMYIVGTTPAIYAFIIGFTDSFSRYLGITMGLVFSLSGLLLAWVLISKFREAHEIPMM